MTDGDGDGDGDGAGELILGDNRILIPGVTTRPGKYRTIA
jgi:hypothetical protein